MADDEDPRDKAEKKKKKKLKPRERNGDMEDDSPESKARKKEKRKSMGQDEKEKKRKKRDSSVKVSAVSYCFWGLGVDPARPNAPPQNHALRTPPLFPPLPETTGPSHPCFSTKGKVPGNASHHRCVTLGDPEPPGSV